VKSMLMVANLPHQFDLSRAIERVSEDPLNQSESQLGKSIPGKRVAPSRREVISLQLSTVDIQSYRVHSTITSRLANTMIQSKVVNKAKHAQSLVFDVQIPKGAFIHNFTMNVNGITFTSSIREKSAARQQYAQARARGKAAGIVRSSALDMENFKAELNVPGGTKVQFEIHYQEVIQRKLGTYEHVIPLQPGRLAKQLEVDVRIIEPQGLRYVNVPNSLGDHFAGITTLSKGEKKAHVSFKPTVAQQRKCPTCSATAVDGNFVVAYDVRREVTAICVLQIFNGYFIHYFAPDNLDPLPKNILFVIDVSGSMWGLKMKQTVEAMKTILGDLRPDDLFSIIDFNHNVRNWRDDLVAATPSQMEDAKKYIQGIHPNGGTNINEALLRAIFILKEASRLGMLDPNSVSMIILVSDGDPTVGELKLTTIQKNVKQNIPDDVSLFSLGIGFDVDYDFLERLAHENHGTAQRIFGNQETSSQMKKFYNKVSTPLLKNVEFNYPRESVSDVTQNSFHNYFGGSEIVVAGKVDSSNVQHLQSVITATAANAGLVLETLEDVEGLDDFLKKEEHADPKFTEKLWAYLTINQLLAERWGEIRDHAFYLLFPTYFCILVDNDPHFIIHLEKSQENICFNIDSEPGKILNLISDPDSGVAVNGQVIGAKRHENKKLSTYFGKIGFYFKNKGLKVEISTETITLKDGSYSTSLSWSDTGSIIRKRLLVSVKKDRKVTITMDTEMSFLVLLHRVWKKHPVNVDFLGIYLPPTNQFSSSVHGLIGQFMPEPEVRIYNERPGQEPEKPEATMEVKGHKLTVTSGMQKDYRGDRVFGTKVHCWFVHNSGKGFVDGHYKDYLVPHLYSFLKNP
uniref:Inter-alpha-trypsin inhibitor heavy chain 2 n=1 Tax=Pelusios castaneus TaxID=367368 RepID=A0A8C8RI50_9SAUR